MKEKIIKLRNEGKTYNEIVSLLGCSKGTVSYHCSNMTTNNDIKMVNLEVKKNMQQKDFSFLLPDDDTVNNIITLRKLKKKYKEIAKELGLTQSVVSKVCRKSGLAYHNNGKLPKSTIEEIIKQYEIIKNVRIVAEKVGVSIASVKKYASNVKRKKLSEDELKMNRVKSVIDWRKKVKLKLVEKKGGKCERCGYNKCIDALEFHHIDPNKKDFSVSGKSWSLEKLEKEVEKCILVCSNCHKEIHFIIKTEGNMSLKLTLTTQIPIV
jgi:predicted transcriptional regulator